ncbi:MAG: putative colanic acid biosynthesis UDP-glucose lipid carrier transferase, partial [Dinoroseobacter sp.]
YSLANHYLVISLALTVLCLCLLAMNGYYEKTRQAAVSVLLIESFKATVIAATLVTLLLYLTKSGADFSRIWMVYTVCISSLMMSIIRFLLNLLSRNSYRKKNILLLGQDSSTSSIKETLRSRNENYLQINKQFTFRSGDKGNDLNDVAAHIESLRSSDEAISEVWIMSDVYSEFTHIELEVALSGAAVRLVYIPMVPDLGFDFEIEKIQGIPTINSELSRPNRLKLAAKWCEDYIASSLVLVSLLPLYAIIAVIIKLDSKGPVFYKQERYGMNGREILVWKFRTMHVTEQTNDFKQAIENDPRFTKFGYFLRKTSLDELPQLINVLTGSMSLVGPRPHPNLLNEEFRSTIDSYMHRHNVKPGITGLAQANGARGETDTLEKMELRIKYDLEYVRKWSILLDMKIIIKTFAEVFKQAFR